MMSFVSATTQEGPPTWQTYLDWSADIKPYLQIDSTNTQFDGQLPDITALACVWVQNYLSRPVAPTTFFRRYDGAGGWNSAHIFLPYWPILSIQSVVEFWGSSGPHTLTEQTPENQGTSDMYQVDPVVGRITRTFRGNVQRPWFPGARNVEITWTAGFDPVPIDIRVATKEYAAYWWRNTQEAPRTSPLTLNEYDPAPTNSLWPAVPNRVTALLEPYLQLNVA